MTAYYLCDPQEVPQVKRGVGSGIWGRARVMISCQNLGKSIFFRPKLANFRPNFKSKLKAAEVLKQFRRKFWPKLWPSTRLTCVPPLGEVSQAPRLQFKYNLIPLTTGASPPSSPQRVTPAQAPGPTHMANVFTAKVLPSLGVVLSGALYASSLPTVHPGPLLVRTNGVCVCVELCVFDCVELCVCWVCWVVCVLTVLSYVGVVCVVLCACARVCVLSDGGKDVWEALLCWGWW